MVFLFGQVTSSGVLGGLGDLSTRLGDGSVSMLKFFQAQQTPFRPWHHHHPHRGLAPPDTDWGQSVFKVGGRCIVSPQFWTDMSCSQTGPLALG